MATITTERHLIQAAETMVEDLFTVHTFGTQRAWHPAPTGDDADVDIRAEADP